MCIFNHILSGRNDMEILILCKSAFQLVSSSRIAETVHKGDNVDMALFDNIANADKLLDSIKRSSFFRDVNIYSYQKYARGRRPKRKAAPYMYNIKLPTERVYDIVYFANVYDWISNQIIHHLREAVKKAGKELEVRMFEDGFSTYSDHYGKFFSRLGKYSPIQKHLTERAYGEYYNISKLFVFTPELVEWKPPFELVPIKKISYDDTDYIREMNIIFNFEKLTDKYDKDIIFFEESYFADNIKVDDIGVIKRIAAIAGKDNIFVKIHPRNPVNRFKGMGICTNENTVVPWEIIAMNIDLTNKLLITIASGSALTSLVNMSVVPKRIIMLANMEGIDETKLTPTCRTLKRIAMHYPETASLPETYEELEDLLGGLC